MTHVVCTTPHWQLNHKSVRFQASLPWGKASSASLNHGGEASFANTKAPSECSEHLAIPDSGRLTLILASRQSPKKYQEHCFWDFPQLMWTITFIIPLPRGTRQRKKPPLKMTLYLHSQNSLCGTKCLEIKYWTVGRTSVWTGLTQAWLLSYQHVIGPESPPRSLVFNFALTCWLGRQVSFSGDGSRPKRYGTVRLPLYT